MSPDAGSYVVLRRVGDDRWQFVGEVRRRPGLPARRARIQAVEDLLGRAADDADQFAVLPLSEWRVARDLG